MTDGQNSNGSCHRVFLIRHGETVDNVAGLYAGVRDSELTVHGSIQTTRLGTYFAKEGVRLTHIFCSTLTRAIKTAESIRSAQPPILNAAGKLLEIIQVSALQEQDFGFYEGKPFFARSKDSIKSGKEQHRAQHKDEEGYQDVESKESMARRADSFLDTFLLPILNTAAREEGSTIAVVSHGILLSCLWRSFLRRQAPDSITLHPNVLERGKPLSLEHLGGWSNTGYLELQIRHGRRKSIPHMELTARSAMSAHLPEGKADSCAVGSQDATLPNKDQVEESGGAEKTLLEPVIEQNKRIVLNEAPENCLEDGSFRTSLSDTVRLQTTIVTINGKEHLKGLKRTGGGLGSSKLDEAQESINSFFKRQRKQ